MTSKAASLVLSLAKRHGHSGVTTGQPPTAYTTRENDRGSLPLKDFAQSEPVFHRHSMRERVGRMSIVSLYEAGSPLRTSSEHSYGVVCKLPS